MIKLHLFPFFSLYHHLLLQTQAMYLKKTDCNATEKESCWHSDLGADTFRAAQMSTCLMKKIPGGKRNTTYMQRRFESVEATCKTSAAKPIQLWVRAAVLSSSLTESMRAGTMSHSSRCSSAHIHPEIWKRWKWKLWFPCTSSTEVIRETVLSWAEFFSSFAASEL